MILGAGYDTRAHRLGVPANVNVFEVDKPDIQRFKQKKISKLELESNARVIYVPVDFNTQSLEEELRKSEVRQLERSDSNIPSAQIPNNQPLVASRLTSLLVGI